MGRLLLPVALLVIITAMALSTAVTADATWVPSKPQGVFEVHSYGNGVLTLRITLFFKHAGFNVTWRGAEIRGSEIRIYVDVYEWTGATAPVLMNKSRVFHLRVRPGIYRLVLMVNGEPQDLGPLYVGVEPPATVTPATVTVTKTLGKPTMLTVTTTKLSTVTSAYTITVTHGVEAGGVAQGAIGAIALIVVGLLALPITALVLAEVLRR
ncbi:MAG: hypothetical protein DRO39_05915 [Thermoprotei archaeon]|nr:MAG: hypothetical protein DRO39_05915 [Thermoprotei archaeon]